MARDCKKCKYFQCMHPNYNDSFACQLDPNCSWIEYKEKKVCKNYEEADETQTTAQKCKGNKMAKINKDLKKAATLAKKLIIDRDRILKSSDKIQKILLTTDLVIGGYKMVQKLRKQKNIFDELADVMNKRIALFQEVANKASEEK